MTTKYNIQNFRDHLVNSLKIILLLLKTYIYLTWLPIFEAKKLVGSLRLIINKLLSFNTTKLNIDFLLFNKHNHTF